MKKMYKTGPWKVDSFKINEIKCNRPPAGAETTKTPDFCPMSYLDECSCRNNASDLVCHVRSRKP
jgi:hypothetical protein